MKDRVYSTKPQSIRARRYQIKHREVCNRRQREWRRKNRDKVKQYNANSWASRRLTRYGLTIDQFHALFEKQNEHCAICPVVLLPFGRETHIDHDHVTGKVRGLLCENCNRGLGMFKDNADFLANAISYIKERKSL